MIIGMKWSGYGLEALIKNSYLRELFMAKRNR